jgi:predicted O-linked N-acetylglucosamine transferase (SPINDLY family)
LCRLPEGLHAYDPFDALPPVGPLPALRNGYVTFGSCNAQTKINLPVLLAWLAILQRVPTAHLLIKNLELADAELRRRTMGWFVERGIASGRIELVGPQKRLEHLAAFQRIDVHLDTFPYNGAVTTCEALWMGVPVLTVRGHCHRGRVGESLQRRAGETGGVADDGDDYITRAVAWSGQTTRLAAEREQRRERIAHSPLADGARHARAIESALTRLALDANAYERD